MIIEVDAGKLVLRYNNWSRDLWHVDQDHFLTTDLYDQSMDIWFEAGAGPVLEKLRMSIEPAVDPVVFERSMAR